MVGPRFDPLQTREPAGSENKKAFVNALSNAVVVTICNLHEGGFAIVTIAATSSIFILHSLPSH
jgi:hypothetical protein